MVQSIELLLDLESDAVIRWQWAALAEAGLPSEQRDRPGDHHAPHITLFAADTLASEAIAKLDAVFAGLDLAVRLGALLIFRPPGRPATRGDGGRPRQTCVLVRQAVASAELLSLQEHTRQLCGREDRSGHFGVGFWTPHVTLARRMPLDQLGRALSVLGDDAPIDTHITHGRHWNGDTRQTRPLGGSS